MSAASDEADGSCDAPRQAALLGDRADPDEFNSRSTLEDYDVATLNTIQAVADTVRAADHVIAVAEKVLGIARYGGSPMVVEAPVQQGIMAPDIGAGETSLGVVEPSSPADESQPSESAEFDGQICELIRPDVAPAGKPQAEGDSEIDTGGIDALFERIAGSTVKEVDRLIDELQVLRDVLQGEAGE
jgi:hypothetical protein